MSQADLQSLIDSRVSLKADRAAHCVGRFVGAYDDDFTGWMNELKLHEALSAQVTRLTLEGVMILEDAKRLTRELESGESRSLGECGEAAESDWLPHVESVRRSVAQLMLERQYKSRTCWIQLRDRATFMIMLLEELQRILAEPETPQAGEDPEEVLSREPGRRKNLGELLAEEVFTTVESHDYDIQHLSLHALLVRDGRDSGTSGDGFLANWFRRLRDWIRGKYRSRSRANGYVRTESIHHLAEILPPLRELFESGLQKYGQGGLPLVYYQFADAWERVVYRRILFGPLLRNLDSLTKVISRVRREVKRKDAAMIYFTLTCFYLREVKVASGFLFRERHSNQESPELLAVQKLFPLAIENLKELSDQIARAEIEERDFSE